ncbi:MAG: agmatine deiminase family protein [Pseudomonadota bacterium]
MTPAKQGFFMPAEWQAHEATWLAWPSNEEDWPDKFAPIIWVYAEIIRVLTTSERVRLLVPNQAMIKAVETILQRNHVDLSQVDSYPVATNRAWLRDSGPTILINHNLEAHAYLLLDWHFNAWAKYADYDKDDKVASAIADSIGAQIIQPTVVKQGKTTRVTLEGGAIDVNGKGTLLTTTECLLSKTQARNPLLTRDDMEQLFADYLAVSQVIWLDHGIVGDDTHGHIDDIARFVNDNTVITVVETDRRDENYAKLQANLQQLKQAKDQDGKLLNVVELPMPSARRFDDTRLPASYANFLIANKVVLVPTFNDANDRVALNILAACFPDRAIVPINSTDLIWGLGAIHCLSQQQPLVIDA